jgi:phosphoribosylglycinamide formyltransferase-1
MTRPDTLQRLTDLCLAMPEVTVEPSGKHVGFVVRGKKFAWYLDDHHGDGKVALQVRMAPGDNYQLVEIDPVRYFLPAYMTHHGWVSLRLDLGAIDWAEVQALLRDSYRLQAPKRLAALV